MADAASAAVQRIAAAHRREADTMHDRITGPRPAIVSSWLS
jgi:hypothetical protein